MRRPIPLIVFLFLTTCTPPAVRAQANLFDHLFWQAFGTHDGRAWGGTGLDTLGFINDSIPHAITIAEAAGNAAGDNVSSFVYNRTKIASAPDTMRHFEFPGQKVIRGDFNHDGKFDVACWDAGARRIIVLFGTDTLTKFDTALVLRATNRNFEYLDHGICVADVDSDSFDDLIVSDELYQNQGSVYPGRVVLWRGGVKMDTAPSAMLVGQPYPNQVGGFIGIGNVRGGQQQYLCELREYGHGTFGPADTAKLFLYPIGPHFRLTPTDSIVMTFDTLRYGPYLSGFALIDVDGDSVTDIEVPSVDKNYRPGNKVAPLVFAYKGGPGISSLPTYSFHCPVTYGTQQWGTKIVDIRDVTGKGYSSMLVTDPIENTNDAGAVFLYNIGKALRDSCVAVALGTNQYFDRLGIQVIGPGDISGDGRADVLVGSRINDLQQGVGSVRVFYGDASYGPDVMEVHGEIVQPAGITLDACYPNPVDLATDISFAIDDCSLYGKEITITMYDMLGRKLSSLYHGVADDFRTTIRVNASRVPEGVYCYTLRCGERQLTKTMIVVH